MYSYGFNKVVRVPVLAVFAFQRPTREDFQAAVVHARQKVYRVQLRVERQKLSTYSLRGFPNNR
jgi:hypothetical protein